MSVNRTFKKKFGFKILETSKANNQMKDSRSLICTNSRDPEGRIEVKAAEEGRVQTNMRRKKKTC